jgi:hypothetical protein
MSGSVMRFSGFVFFGLSGLAFGGVLAGTAAAQESQSQSFTIRAHAHSVCKLSVLENAGASNMTLNPDSGAGGIVTIPALSDANTDQVQPASIALTVNIICNRAHSLKVTTGHGGLSPAVAGSEAHTGFANRVDYATHANWGGAAALLQTSGVSGQASPEIHSPGAYTGNLSLQILVDRSGAGNLPLEAGSYTDSLKLTLSAHY